MHPPRWMEWVFWDVDIDDIDVERDVNYVLGRILEHASLREVRWAMRHYGRKRIHKFFREVGDPELSDRTLGFWRAFFHAEEERWAAPPAWRKRSPVPWPP